MVTMAERLIEANNLQNKIAVISKRSDEIVLSVREIWLIRVSKSNTDLVLSELSFADNSSCR